MKTYRFELEAFQEIDVEADNIKEATDKAFEVWRDIYGKTSSFGEPYFIKEVEE